jgi:hypothetical protein
MQPFVKNFKLLGYSRKHLLFIVHDYSLPCLQEPVSGTEKLENRNSDDGLQYFCCPNHELS